MDHQGSPQKRYFEEVLSASSPENGCSTWRSTGPRLPAQTFGEVHCTDQVGQTEAPPPPHWLLLMTQTWSGGNPETLLCQLSAGPGPGLRWG